MSSFRGRAGIHSYYQLLLLVLFPEFEGTEIILSPLVNDINMMDMKYSTSSFLLQHAIET